MLLNHIWLSFRVVQVAILGTVAWTITPVKFAEARCHSMLRARFLPQWQAEDAISHGQPG